MDERIAVFQERFQLTWQAAMMLECVWDGEMPKTVKFPDKNAKCDEHDIFEALHELVGKNVIEVSGSLTLKWVKPDYRAYLNSDAWKVKADAAKERAGQRCQICNAQRGSTVLDAHHRTYERLGNELDGDLVVLCRICHDTFHQAGKLAR